MDGRKTGQQIVDHIRKQGFFVVDREPTADERRAHPKVAKVVVGPARRGSRTPMDLPISQEVIRDRRKRARSGRQAADDGRRPAARGDRAAARHAHDRDSDRQPRQQPLFNVRTDLGERKDLMGERSEIARRMAPLMAAWQKDVDGEAKSLTQR